MAQLGCAEPRPPYQHNADIVLGSDEPAQPGVLHLVQVRVDSTYMLSTLAVWHTVHMQLLLLTPDVPAAEAAAIANACRTTSHMRFPLLHVCKHCTLCSLVACRSTLLPAHGYCTRSTSAQLLGHMRLCEHHPGGGHFLCPNSHCGTATMPCSTWFVCRKHGLPVEMRMIRLDKGEHKKPAYLQINPLGKVRGRCRCC